MGRPVAVVALLCCLCFCSTGLYVAAHSSATSDEVPHIFAGVRYLQGDLRLNREHPPLVKVLAALALPAREPPLALPEHIDAERSQWVDGAAWLHEARQPPLALLLRARVPVIALGAMLIVLLASCAYWCAGTAAATVGAVLLATCPLWLAHATLVTTDAAASLWFFATACCGARLSHAPPDRRRGPALGLALSLALALMTKYSMLALPALTLLAVALDAHRRRDRALLPWGALASGLGTVVGVCGAWGWPPNPALYADGVSRVGANHLEHYPFYAFGRLYLGQDPGYFVRALSVKLAVPVLALCLMAPPLAYLLRRRGAQPLFARGSWHFVVGPLGYLALMSWKAPALGVRYVLPVLPFLTLLAATAAAGLVRSRLSWVVACLGLLQLGSLAVALRATPLAFFNGLGCYTGDVPPCLDDSNVDWGHALPALRAFADAQYPQTSLRLFYFGSSPPQAYVPQAQVAHPQELLQPQHALYAVSLHMRARAPSQSWVHLARPVAVPGGAYAVYDLR